MPEVRHISRVCQLYLSLKVVGRYILHWTIRVEWVFRSGTDSIRGVFQRHLSHKTCPFRQKKECKSLPTSRGRRFPSYYTYTFRSKVLLSRGKDGCVVRRRQFTRQSAVVIINTPLSTRNIDEPRRHHFL